MRLTVAALVTAALALAALEARAETPGGWFDLAVQGGDATLAALGISYDERALTLSLLARAVHDSETATSVVSSDRLRRVVATLGTPMVGAVTDRDTVNIPVPLDEASWRQLLELKTGDDLFARFLVDRNALVLAAALTATDPSIRHLVTRDPDLLRFLYLEGAGAFVIAARHMKVAGGRLVAPGNADAIWETLAGSPTSEPAAFLRALVSKDQGRLAWYFDTIASLDPGRLAAVWPPAAPAARQDLAKSIYQVFRDSEPQWHIAEQPFRRKVADAWTVVSLTEVSNGGLAGPASAGLWSLLFSNDLVDRDDAARRLGRDSQLLTMAALLRSIANSPTGDRRMRFEMFRLGQRVFGHARVSELPAVAVALSGYRRYRSLLLALERMQITDVETWAALVAAARHVDSDADDERKSLAVFQGAIALVERIRHVRTIDAAAADSLLRSLCTAVVSTSKVASAIGRWIVTILVRSLPPLERPDAWTGKTAYESTILQALGGPLESATPSITWEGLTYTVDVIAAERARLRAIRLLAPSPGLDAALESNDPGKLATALTALVYVTALGDRNGAATLGRDVATRHDFGFDGVITPDLAPWLPPEERQGTGPWHIHGSLIGLDLGLSRLMLNRLADQEMPAAPTLTLNDFATLTRTIAALVPGELVDGDRDELAAAIARGRRRVADAGADRDALAALAEEIRTSADVSQLLPWIATRQPDALARMFSLRDLMWLGKPALAQAVLDRWGVAASGLDGRMLTAMPVSAPWEDFAGRADAGQMATQVPDVALRIVEETARLRLPAVLIPSILAFAIADYWHDVQARFADDWPRMTRQALDLDASRIQDYVAGLAGGPLRPR